MTDWLNASEWDKDTVALVVAGGALAALYAW